MTFVTTGFARVLIAGVYGWRDLLSPAHRTIREKANVRKGAVSGIST